MSEATGGSDDTPRSWRRRRYLRLRLAAFGAALTLAACASLAGLSGGRVDASTDDAGGTKDVVVIHLPEVSTDAPEMDVAVRQDASVRKDAAGDAPADAPADHGHDTGPVCVPVATSAVPLGDGGSCPVPDASCYPQPVSPAALVWVPPTTPSPQCTQAELDSIGTTSAPTLSPMCQACEDSETNYSSYGAQVDFPQVTFVGYGFANVAGCVAILEPCNQPCAQLLLQADLCSSDACLPSCHPISPETYSAMIPCLESAQSGCPCGAITAAANQCFNEILERQSPAAACLPPMVGGESQQQAYYAELKAVATVLCGVRSADAG